MSSSARFGVSTETSEDTVCLPSSPGHLPISKHPAADEMATESIIKSDGMLPVITNKSLTVHIKHPVHMAGMAE